MDQEGDSDEISEPEAQGYVLLDDTDIDVPQFANEAIGESDHLKEDIEHEMAICEEQMDINIDLVDTNGKMRQTWLQMEEKYFDEEFKEIRESKPLGTEESKETSHWGESLKFSDEQREIIRETMGKINMQTPEWAKSMKEHDLGNIVDKLLQEKSK